MHHIPYILVYKSAFFSKIFVKIIQSDLYSGEVQIQVRKLDKLNMWSGVSVIPMQKYQSTQNVQRLNAYQIKENISLDENPVYFIHNLPQTIQKVTKIIM